MHYLHRHKYHIYCYMTELTAIDASVSIHINTYIEINTILHVQTHKIKYKIIAQQILNHKLCLLQYQVAIEMIYRLNSFFDQLQIINMVINVQK